MHVVLIYEKQIFISPRLCYLLETNHHFKNLQKGLERRQIVRACVKRRLMDLTNQKLSAGVFLKNISLHIKGNI